MNPPPTWKCVLFPLWYLIFTPILWICWKFSDYSKGWEFNDLLWEAKRVYWGDKKKGDK